MSRVFRVVSALVFLCLACEARARVNLPDFSELADAPGAAVVNLSTTRSANPQDKLREFFRNNPRSGPFNEFFEEFGRRFKDDAPPRSQRSMGSGFIISRDGFIVTNNHVIEDADEIKVHLRGRDKPLAARAVGRDPELDLAVVKIEDGRDLPFLEFGDSDALKVGAWVLAIGNPFGLENSVTAGIISAKGRVIGAGPYDNFLQTDASINPGNSGGPLLDLDGKVIGINTAIIATGQGIGFAIPSNTAKAVIAELKDQKQVKRGWLGVSIQNVDENTAKALGLSEAQGALVSSVMENDPAAKAGVVAGDVILEVNGQSVKDAAALLRAVAAVRPGGKAELTVWRKGRKEKLSAVLGQRDAARLAKQDGAAPETPPAIGALGLTVRPLAPEESKARGLEPGTGLAVGAVGQGSAAQEAGIRPGDVLLEANQQAVNSVAELARVLAGPAREKGVALLLVRRDKRSLFISVPMPDAQ